MKRHSIIFIFLTVIKSFLIAQEPRHLFTRMDSLKIELKNAKHDTSRCRILNEIIETENDDNVWQVFNQQMQTIAEHGLHGKLQSIDLAQKSLNIIFFKYLANALNNIGLLSQQQGNNPRALEYFHKSLKIDEEIGDKNGIVSSLNNIGWCLMLQVNINDQPQRILILKEVLNYAERSFAIAKESGYPQNIKNTAHLLFKVLKEQNRPEEALEMHELFIQIGDSINNSDNRNAASKQQFKYEYEKKELFLKAEQEKKDIVRADQSKFRKIIIGFVVLGFALLLMFSLFLLSRFKITQKQKLIIEKQKYKVDHAYNELNEKNKEVTDSIIYARRIQRALLTSENYIRKHLNRLIKN
jgi:tetratricopeptide (TPR) repeat protein